jgi:hypothetical protein
LTVFWALTALMISGNRDVQLGQLVGLDPQPHGVLAGAEDGDAGDSLDPRHLVVDVDVRVVGEKDVVVGAVRRVEREHDQRRRGRLGDGDAVVAHVRRQLRLGLALAHLGEQLVGGIDIRHPLPQVAAHVVDAERVGRIAPHGQAAVALELGAFGGVRPLGCGLAAEALGAPGAAAGVFPLCLGGEAEHPAGVLLAQPTHELGDVGLVDAVDRMRRRGGEHRQVVVHQPGPLLLGDLVAADPVRRHAHLVHRELVGLAVAEGVAHVEAPPRHADELHAGRRLPPHRRLLGSGERRRNHERDAERGAQAGAGRREEFPGAFLD